PTIWPLSLVPLAKGIAGGQGVVNGHTANVCVVMRDSVASDRGPIPAIRLSPGRKRDGRKYGTPSRRWAGLKPASSSTATSRCELRGFYALRSFHCDRY